MTSSLTVPRYLAVTKRRRRPYSVQVGRFVSCFIIRSCVLFVVIATIFTSWSFAFVNKFAEFFFWNYHLSSIYGGFAMCQAAMFLLAMIGLSVVCYMIND